METITRRIELDMPAEALWSAITDREALELWLGDTVDVEIRPGGVGVIVDDGDIREVVVRSMNEGTGWSFEWHADGVPPSTVTFEISTVDDGTSALTITETLSAEARAGDRGFRWELCALLLWACTFAAALVR